MVASTQAAALLGHLLLLVGLSARDHAGDLLAGRLMLVRSGVHVQG
jgi:hypothetical protein